MTAVFVHPDDHTEFERGQERRWEDAGRMPRRPGGISVGSRRTNRPGRCAKPGQTRAVVFVYSGGPVDRREPRRAVRGVPLVGSHVEYSSGQGRSVVVVAGVIGSDIVQTKP
jgi:hypothetical protein